MYGNLFNYDYCDFGDQGNVAYPLRYILLTEEKTLNTLFGITDNKSWIQDLTILKHYQS